MHPNQIKQWKDLPLTTMQDVFGIDKQTQSQLEVDIKHLRIKIGELTLKNDFLSGAFTNAGLLIGKR